MVTEAHSEMPGVIQAKSASGCVTRHDAWGALLRLLSFFGHTCILSNINRKRF